MNKLINFLRAIFLSERGEEDPGQGGDPSADAGQGTATQDAPEGDGTTDADNGQGTDAPAKAPKYGEFGETADPDKLYEAFTKIKADHDGLTKKTSATERNLAAIRKTLEESGIKIVPTEDGSIQLALAENPTPAQVKKQKRFAEDHKKKFSSYFQAGGEDFLGLITLHVQDVLDEMLDNREVEGQKKTKEMREFAFTKQQSNARMVELFPAIDPKFDQNGKPTNPQFNKALWERATEIWEKNYKKNPKGELFAALEAAAELKVSPTSLEQAKAAGFNAGKEAKKVLGPVNTSTQKSSGGGTGELSRDEYLKLSPEERAKYDKKNLGIQ